MLAAGQRLGPYEIVAPLGAGGMGEVWRARDTRLGREVALKILPEEFAADAERLRRFEQEARAVAALNHPNILALFDVGTHDATPYLVTELLDGETLRERLDRGPVPVRDAVGIAAQIAKGLGAGHEKGIVHRDIKPANVFLTNDGQVKILDFGLARVMPAIGVEAAGAETVVDATRAGATLGTAAYMSPEQVRGHAVDPRSDLFSLGAVVFEMLSGRRAFERGSAVDGMAAILHEGPGDPGPARIPGKLRSLLRRLLEKDPAAAVLDDLAAMDERRAPRLSRRASTAIAVAAALSLLLGGWWLRREARIRHAREVLIPRAEHLLGEARGVRDYPAVYTLVADAEKVVPGDPKVASLMSWVSGRTTFLSEPPGAAVSIRPYDDPHAPWERIGITPIRDLRLPATYYAIRFEKTGYEPVLAASLSSVLDLSVGGRKAMTIRRVLDRVGTLPAGMVRVSGVAGLPDYFIDATEVTNRAFRAFVDAGGYQKQEHWKDLLAAKDGAQGWPGAIAEFVDQTGRPGPATWQAGDFPPGKDRHPVSGISWYEAAAFAAWSGKSLPTSRHWQGAYDFGLSGTLSTAMNNFQGAGPDPVGNHPAISAFGASDMAGNVREWCWNGAPGGRVLRGGAWDDTPYVADAVSVASPLDRSPRNGFRCAKLPDPAAVPAAALAPVEPGARHRDYRNLRPAPDPVFQAYREQFDYDRSDLAARVEWRNASARDWVQERVSFNAAYGGERMVAHLFLPTRGKPPFQTVVYFPGSGSAEMRSSRDLATYWEFTYRLVHFLKSGRAVVYPVYTGTFERGTDEMVKYIDGAPTHQYTELLVRMVKDLRRTLDYLETRPELDASKVAYCGFSWGGMYGAIIPAVEPRLATSLLVVGGLNENPTRPEADPISYLGRVKLPTLMLNGRNDVIFPLESSVRPMYDLLGTPPGNKVLKLYDTDHYIPFNEMVKETLAWLDTYLGPVR